MKILVRTLLSLFICISVFYCSSDSRFIITSSSVKNPNFIGMQCKEVFSKRVYYFPYVIPLNEINNKDIEGMKNNNSLQYSQGLEGLDLFFTILGAAFGLIVQTQVLESCEAKKDEIPNKKCYFDRNFNKIFCENNTYVDPETNYNIGVFDKLFMLY